METGRLGCLLTSPSLAQRSNPYTPLLNTDRASHSFGLSYNFYKMVSLKQDNYSKPVSQ